MPDAGRAAHAPRVATAVRPAVAALLLPLLTAAFLTALWLLGGNSAHALALDGDVDGSETGGPAPATDDAGDTGAAEDTDANPDPAEDTIESGGTRTSLDTLVPNEVTGEVTAPVTDTLGSVHQRVEGSASGPGDGGLPETGLPVAEVGEGARRVAEGLGREDDTGSGSGLTSVITGEGAPTSDATSEDHAETADRGHDAEDAHDTGRDRPASGHTALDGPGTTLRTTADPTPALEDTAGTGADAASEAGAGSETGEPSPSHPASAPTTSAQTGGPAAPAVAGFLPSTPIAGPASTTVRPWSAAPHGVPADPADDPTLSPD